MIHGIFWLVILAVLGSCGGIIHAHLVHWRRQRARERQAAERRPE